ncbi:MAG: DUF86 domain-containing protein [Desulfohalobiaceae bacterium]|nr:DUF86 domain-containing protein [Desulfohalobiaceae bacterium]
MKTIEKKILAVEHRISKLKSMALRVKSLEEYIAARDNTDIAERNIQVAIEACLDIGKIIIGNKDLPEPADNKGVFSVLAEAGVITKESLGFLIPMAGTRNILVHGYDRVDDALIYGIIKKHLQDFENFLNQVKVYAQNEK